VAHAQPSFPAIDPAERSAVPSAPAVVQAASTVPDQGGFDVVNLLVPSAQAAPLARLLSTQQFALNVTSRAP